MNQMLKLLEYSQCWPARPSFYITTLDAPAGKLSQRGPVYVIGECNRQHPIKAVKVFFKCLRIALQERPDVVVTTGSLPIAIFCILAKMFGAKIVWIDSIANIEQFSMSGRMIRPLADLFLTQWPELSREYENIEYVGAIL